MEAVLEVDEVNNESDSQDTVDLSLQNFDLCSQAALQAMLKALDLPGKVKVLKKLLTLPAPRLMEIIRMNSLVRTLLLNHQNVLLPLGVLANMEVQREVVNNPLMPKTSSKYLGICHFMPDNIARFVHALLNDLFRENVANVKILVVVEGSNFARQVAEKLNTSGYAVYTAETPKNAFRAYLHQLQNWPVFLVASDVFSGNAFGRMDAAFVFRHRHEMSSLVALEYQMAFNACFRSALVSPATEQGLFHLADAYNDFRLYLPIRI